MAKVKKERAVRTQLRLKQTEQAEQAAPEQATPMLDENKRRFVEERGRSIYKEYDDAAQDLEYIEGRLREYMDAASKYSAALTSAQLRLADLEASREELTQMQLDSFAAEYDKLCALPVVKSVECTSQHLIVHTGMMYIDDVYHDNGKTYRIGEFAVCLPFSPGTASVKLCNETKVYALRGGRGHHHPHVANNPADICWGNVGGAISTTVAKREYLSAVIIITQWLQSFGYWEQHKDWIQHFPLISMDQKREEQQAERTALGKGDTK